MVTMLDLHERLSEFSYGYGVTREFESALTAKGIRAVPFLPSLLHEAKVGFDVAWKKTGCTTDGPIQTRPATSAIPATSFRRENT
jgi:hypothetical protein